jgi:hypothetical protein
VTSREFKDTLGDSSLAHDPEKLAPAKAGVADFSDKIMRKINEKRALSVQRYRKTLNGEKHMRKLAGLFAATATLLAVALSPTTADAGCYRLGETGYHWYRYCFGPAFLYPHRRVCPHGHCWYR